jgi:NADH dehydrogenase [ubiquinone] 1 alpha subcomplex assembly factor 7
MTPLGHRLIRRIRASGPITLADYMADCLLDPEHGYYAMREPFGTAGDFTTAPEISQMFGELIGLCLAQSWLDQGAPNPFALAELGPGRGTLMADLLRATRGVPGFNKAMQLHLVEASPRLRTRQRDALPGHMPQWHDTVDSLPDGPLFLVANEFFDALPIRQFHRSGAGWREVMVTAKGDLLAFGLSDPAAITALAGRTRDTSDGDIVEICPAAAPIAAAIAARIATRGGVALIVDYGGWRSLGDTFQAVRGHRPADPLAHPGQDDLTAHVDFEPLALAAQEAGAATLISDQGPFLERLGIAARADRLAESLAGEAQDVLRAAHRRLTDAKEMGHLFKVLAIHPPLMPPPGFAA